MAGQWDIEAFPGGNYVLKIDGLFAAEIDEIKNLLFAVAPESIGLWVPVCTFIIRAYILHFEKFQ